MYRTYPNTISDGEPGSYTAEDARRGVIALHTDYECPFCGRNQSVAAMGGYGGCCVECGRSSNPAIAAEAAESEGE